MSFSVDTSQLRTLSADLGRASGRIKRKAGQAIAKTALDVERIAKTRVPVDTGATRESITARIDRSALSATIGPTTYYAPFLEFGTRRMAARPFMGPALEAVKPGYVAAMERIAEGAFRD